MILQTTITGHQEPDNWPIKRPRLKYFNISGSLWSTVEAHLSLGRMLCLSPVYLTIILYIWHIQCNKIICANITYFDRFYIIKILNKDTSLTYLLSRRRHDREVIAVVHSQLTTTEHLSGSKMSWEDYTQILQRDTEKWIKLVSEII